MKKWLKFFGLSFFLNKEAEKAPRFGLGSALLAIVFAMVFFLFGYYASDVLPFGSNYDRAGQYRQFIHRAFDGNVRIDIKEQKANVDMRINTYTDDLDRTLYTMNGYDLIVDTRPSDMLVCFEQVAIKDGKEISFEEYRLLNEDAKKEYTLKVTYTDEEMVISSDLGESYAAYLEKISTETDEEYCAEARKEYAELKTKQSALTEEEYDKSLYYLYVEYYYDQVNSSFQGAKAPVLRDYYYNHYIKAGKAYYFYVFDNLCSGSFETDSGVPVVFGGYYNKCPDGEITDVDGFIKQVYYDTAGYTFVSYVVSTIALFSTLAIAPLIVALAMWSIGKLHREGNGKSFVGCYKIVASFIGWTALIISLAMFIGGWFVSARILYKLIPASFTGILAIRTMVFGISTAITKRKILASSSKNEDNEIQDDEARQFKDIYGGNL